MRRIGNSTTRAGGVRLFQQGNRGPPGHQRGMVKAHLHKVYERFGYEGGWS